MTLNESPSEKEGKLRWLGSACFPAMRSLNESPSEKEGKSSSIAAKDFHPPPQ